MQRGTWHFGNPRKRLSSSASSESHHYFSATSWQFQAPVANCYKILAFCLDWQQIPLSMSQRTHEQKKNPCLGLISCVFLRFEWYCMAFGLHSAVRDSGGVRFVIQPCIIYEFSFQECSSPWHCNATFSHGIARTLPFCPKSSSQNSILLIKPESGISERTAWGCITVCL